MRDIRNRSVRDKPIGSKYQLLFGNMVRNGSGNTYHPLTLRPALQQKKVVAIVCKFNIYRASVRLLQLLQNRLNLTGKFGIVNQPVERYHIMMRRKIQRELSRLLNKIFRNPRYNPVNFGVLLAGFAQKMLQMNGLENPLFQIDYIYLLGRIAQYLVDRNIDPQVRLTGGQQNGIIVA